MKNIILKIVILVLICIPFYANAAYLKNVPISLTQPDGKVIQCFATGDEYYNWVHDKDNYTIIQNKESGYYVYAKLINNELISTQYIVGTVNPASVGLQSGINISSAKMLQIRQSMIKQISNKPTTKTNKSVAATGTINNIVIFIRFSGESEYTDLSSLYSNMFNTTTSGYNSMKNYFDEVSYNTLTINSTFYPIPSGTTVISYQDQYTRQYYQPYNASTNPIGMQTMNDRLMREQTLLQSAVNAVSSQIPSSLNLDNDNDGYVDNVCFMIYGSVASPSWGLLWPHAGALSSLTATINGVQVMNFNLQIQAETMIYGNGVLCHEMFHILGAPDLYHFTYDGNTPVGMWDLMERDMNPPQHMGSYMKYMYGQWISSIPQITTSGTYTLNPVTSSTNNCYKIASPNSTTEYFVLEYRRKTGPFESSVPASGLLIYRINSSLQGNGNTNGPPDEVYLYRPYGTTTDDGNIDDANFSSNVNRTSFNNTTNPTCFLSNGQPGGLNISNITSAGTTISFTYNAPATNLTELKESKDIIIYPNPANSFITIINNETNSIIKLYNLSGQLIKEQKLNDIESTIDIKDLLKGLYIIEIVSDKNIYHSKIIKE